MKFLAWSLLFLSCAPLSIRAGQLQDVKSVYVYPMSGGFDQLLASRLTRDHVFLVVSDPKLADAVFTEQLGTSFEYKLNHIVPPQPPPAPAAGTPTAPATGTPLASSQPAAQDAEPKASSFSRARGTVFLVDPKSKQVLWSIYERPKNTSPHELDRTAKKVAGHLSASLKPASPKAQ